MILIAAAVLVAMFAGSQARRITERTDAVVTRSLDFVLFILLPIIGFAFASRLELKLSTIVGIFAGYGVIATVGLIAWQVTNRMHLSRRQQGAVVLCVVLANTGYFGLPVAATLLGSDELPQAVAWDQLISGPMALLVAPFIAGAFAGRHEDLHLGHRMLAVLRRSPAIPALIAGLLAPDAWVPDPFLDFATLCVYASLPLGFFAVGATIRRLQHGGTPPPRKAVMLAVGLRILAAPLIFAGLVLVLPDEPRAFMLQAAMPCGINALVVGHAFNLDRGLISLAIAWSTAILIAAGLVVAYVL